jgi:murein DD-endopeptidase MepM/ murein hydrolase activator NlpD
MFGIYQGRLTSWFNHYRPNAPAQPLHKGWDVCAAPGTFIRALGRCQVVRVRDFDTVGGYHQEVSVYYPDAIAWVLYGHVMQGIVVKVGQQLRPGDVIARVGTSYDAMGTTPHAHVQCWKDKANLIGYSNATAFDPARVRNFYGGF